ncbi:hypothetical protein ANN_01101, partial [Periplaneta americana]
WTQGRSLRSLFCLYVAKTARAVAKGKEVRIRTLQPRIMVFRAPTLLAVTMLIWQQDGAPPHFGVAERDVLNKQFHEWIGRRGTTEWSPRSCDLTPCDFSLRSILKQQDLHQLRHMIEQSFVKIDENLIAFTTLKFTGTTPHVLEDTPLINRQHIHFLHDGAPAHFSRTARRYLDRRFPVRWIGRGGPIAWPPRSPDLNPLDFYLWDHLKSLVYSSPVPDLESLRNRIVACSEDIRNTPGVWDHVRRSMRHRCEVCIQAGGGHFEHLL